MEPLLLRADHVVTMTAGYPVIVDGAVLVGADGRIAAVGDGPTLLAAHPSVAVRRLYDRILMPGLINSHCHSGLLRGTAEGLPVWEWLRVFIDPMHRVLTAREAEVASWLCYAEALLSGTTTIVDMWRYMHGSARAAEALGIRAIWAPGQPIIIEGTMPIVDSAASRQLPPQRCDHQHGSLSLLGRPPPLHR